MSRNRSIDELNEDGLCEDCEYYEEEQGADELDSARKVRRRLVTHAIQRPIEELLETLSDTLF